VPHLQILQAPAIRDLARQLTPFAEPRPGGVLKLLDVYVNPAARHMLLEVVVVEAHLRQNFFLLVREEETMLLIRCHPILPVQKTDGVKEMIVAVGRRIVELAPAARIGNTNLAAHLPPEWRPSAPGTARA
jgi:hypothetical protein